MQRRLTLLTLLLAALLVSLAGCGTDKGARSLGNPQTPADAAVPQFLRTGPATGAHALGLDPSGTGATEKTVYVSAAWGGRVACGRYKVVIPPGALANDMNITVRDLGTGYVMCELLPHGTRFLRPVLLQMDLSDLELGLFSDWTIFWYNDNYGRWEDQHALYFAGTASVYLWHFSDYAAGRGGW